MKKSTFIHNIWFTQFLKFSVVGLLNSGIHYLVFLVGYRFAGIHYLAASAIGYCIGLLNSFMWNRLWTFKTAGTNAVPEFVRFLIVNLISLTINLVSLEFFVSFPGTSPELGQIFAIFCSLFANFLGNKFWTFRAIAR